MDTSDEIDDHGLETEQMIYDTDDEDDDDEDEDVQKVVNDNDSEGNDLDWEDIDPFDDDDFEDEETAVDRMERELRGDEIKEKADLMARQLRRILKELDEVKTYPSSHRYLSELPPMGIDNVSAWHRHTVRRETVRRARILRPTFAKERTGNIFGD